MDRIVHEKRRGKSALVAAALLMTSFPSFVAVADAAPPCTKDAAQVAVADDRRTTDEVERRIASDETIAPFADRVKVTTSEGVVTLRGTVTSEEDRLVLASLAEGTPGVRRVEDRLTLR